MGKKAWVVVGMVLGSGFLVQVTREAAARERSPAAVRIGVVETLFRDAPEPMVKALMEPFAAMMEERTGRSGELVASGGALDLGKKLAEDKVQLGVFHGIEFAWAKQKYAQLRPLAVVVNQKRHLSAYLLVKKGKVGEFGELEGKTVAMPRFSHEHCYEFLRRQCRQAGKEMADFLKVTKPANAEDALDDLAEGVVQGAVIEEVALDRYRHRKPGRFARLQVLVESEVFPASVIAYRPGSLDEETIHRFREALLTAHQTPVGRQLMTLWRVTGFEAVPSDYQETVRNILKVYPAPQSEKH